EHSSNGSEDGQFVFNIDGHYSLTSSGPRPDTGELRYYIGKADAPFRSSSDDEGLTIAGEYGFAHVGDFASEGDCYTGAVTVTTEQGLEHGDGQSPFSAGTLRLSAGDNSATVTFSGNSVTITSGASIET